jgi:hypothetical protein
VKNPLDKPFLKALEAAASLPTVSVTWSTRKTVVKTGEYKTELLTEHFTDDEMFSITPQYRQTYARKQGVRGPLGLWWSQKGYRLRDRRDVPSYLNIGRSHQTVRAAKKAVERVVRKP